MTQFYFKFNHRHRWHTFFCNALCMPLVYLYTCWADFWFNKGSCKTPFYFSVLYFCMYVIISSLFCRPRYCQFQVLSDPFVYSYCYYIFSIIQSILDCPRVLCLILYTNLNLLYYFKSLNLHPCLLMFSP